MENKLNVWLHDQLAGVLLQNKGLLTFTYNDSYLATPIAMSLSCSLPLQSEAFGHDATRAFFSGLLPEGEKRFQIAKVLHITERNDFQFLRAIGGECAGAVSLLPEGEIPTPESFSEPLWLRKEDIKQIIQEMPKRPMLAGEKGIRLSLAGAQDKLPVIVKEDKIGIPLNNTPSTHILKPAIQDIDGTVYNEAFCLELARRLSIPCVTSVIGIADDVPYLLISRYDRTLINGYPHRMHQEDFCQALGIAPETKYESEGGPGVIQCVDLINRFIGDEKSKLQFADIVIYNYIIGNNDAHGKNFSLIHHNNHQCRLAPFYDLISTSVYPNLTNIMAMKIGSKNTFKDVEIRHWNQFSKDCDIDFSYIKQKIDFFIQEMPFISKNIINEYKQKNWYHPICDEIQKLIQDRSRALKNKFTIFSYLEKGVGESYENQKRLFIESKLKQIERIEQKINTYIVEAQKQMASPKKQKFILSIFKQSSVLDSGQTRIKQLEERREFIRLIRTSMNGKLVEELATRKLRRLFPHLAALHDAETQDQAKQAAYLRLQQAGRGHSLTRRREH